MGAQSKLLLVLIDGVGDVTMPRYGNLTPLELAHTPFMDAIAACGLTGLLDPVEPGRACGSDTAHLSLLGYDPRRYYRGRGAFECMGAGLDMGPGDLAFKSNFATLDVASGVVLRRRADRNFEHLGPTLCQALDGVALPGFPAHRVSVRYATEHRCAVVVRGPGLCDRISGTDPLKDGRVLLRAAPLDHSEEAAHTARVIEAVSGAFRGVLEEHEVNVQRRAAGLPPANVVLLRGPACRVSVPGFEEMHGLTGAVLAPTKIIAGLGLSLGLQLVTAPGATGAYDSDLSSKARCAAHALVHGPARLLLLHVKAVDDAGHDRRPDLKVRFLESVDAMLGAALRLLSAAEVAGGPRTALLLTGDHSTPALFGDHSHEPVPLALAHVRHVAAAASQLLAAVNPDEPSPRPDVSTEPESVHAIKRSCTAAVAARARATAALAAHIRWDGVAQFDERAVAAGALGRFPGSELMPLVQEFLGATEW